MYKEINYFIILALIFILTTVIKALFLLFTYIEVTTGFGILDNIVTTILAISFTLLVLNLRYISQ